MLGQKWRFTELPLAAGTLNHHRLSSAQRESELRLAVHRNNRASHTPILPSRARAQLHGFTVRQDFKDVTELHFQRLGGQNDRLVQQRGQIVVPDRELPKRTDDRLLEGTVEQSFFGLFPFFDSLLQR